LDGDLNSQSLELADQPSLLCLRVPKALEVVGAEVHVVDLAGENVPVTVLNRAPGPLLARWHPELGHYESMRPAGVSPLEHERNWDKAKELGKLRVAGKDYEVADGDVLEIRFNV